MAMTTETVWAALDALLDYAKNCGLLRPLDETFARNTLLSELGWRVTKSRNSALISRSA